jgi:hypothetical protein
MSQRKRQTIQHTKTVGKIVGEIDPYNLSQLWAIPSIENVRERRRCEVSRLMRPAKTVFMKRQMALPHR